MALSIEDVLNASRQDQRAVTVYFHGRELKGVVTNFSELFVELRQSGGQSLIRIASIDAVTRE